LFVFVAFWFWFWFWWLCKLWMDELGSCWYLVALQCEVKIMRVLNFLENNNKEQQEQELKSGDLGLVRS
jgi:hypothetical protein